MFYHLVERDVGLALISWNNDTRETAQKLLVAKVTEKAKNILGWEKVPYEHLV